MRPWLVILALLAAVLSLAGCTFNGAQPVSDPSVPVAAQAGQEFSLVLNSNATTGFRWELEQPLDAQYLQLVGSTYQTTGGNASGAGGQETWRFKALAPGQTTIHLRYARPGDNLKGDSEVFTVNIR